LKLAILTQYYPPDMGAPQARLSELARRFISRGHEVSVITAMPNYPTGRVLDGYGGALRREIREGVSVLRTFIYPSQSAALLPRVASYLSFAASSAIVAPFLAGSADFLLVESPPLLLGPTAWWLSGWAGARLIFNVSDLWPESAVHVGVLRRDSGAFRAAAALEAFCYRRAWLVTGQSKTIVADIDRRFPEVRTYHLSNGADTSRFTPSARTGTARTALGGEDGTVVLYAGLHGLAQGLDQVLEAADRLRERPGLRFVFVGDGPEKQSLIARAERAGLRNVMFLPPRPFAEVPALLASADVIVVPLKSEIPGAVPSKLYEAMASGRPTVMIGAGEPAEIVRRHDAGAVVAPGDVEALARAIEAFAAGDEDARAAGANARRAAVAHFDRDAICARFIDYLEAA
jgi:colanic acid biosynthesis glycosyl transferase WcaI